METKLGKNTETAPGSRKAKQENYPKICTWYNCDRGGEEYIEQTSARKYVETLFFSLSIEKETLISRLLKNRGLNESSLDRPVSPSPRRLPG